MFFYLFQKNFHDLLNHCDFYGRVWYQHACNRHVSWPSLPAMPELTKGRRRQRKCTQKCTSKMHTHLVWDQNLVSVLGTETRVEFWYQSHNFTAEIETAISSNFDFCLMADWKIKNIFFITNRLQYRPKVLAN